MDRFSVVIRTDGEPDEVVETNLSGEDADTLAERIDAGQHPEHAPDDGLVMVVPVLDRLLSCDDVHRIQAALHLAAEAYAEDAKRLKEEADRAVVGDKWDRIKRLEEQFYRQRDYARALANKIEAAEGIKIMGTQP